MKKLILLPILALMAGCATPGPYRVFLDSTTHTDDAPAWSQKLEKSWVVGQDIFFSSTYTIRGDERVNGCFDLVLLDSREQVLSEIAIDIRGSIDHASQSISENAEVILGKVRTGEFSGRISGLKSYAQYFERYIIGTTERINCYVLSKISKANYDKTKHSVLYKM